MKRKLVEICVLTLLIATALPAVGTMNIQTLDEKEDGSSVLWRVRRDLWPSNSI